MTDLSRTRSATNPPRRVAERRDRDSLIVATFAKPEPVTCPLGMKASRSWHLLAGSWHAPFGLCIAGVRSVNDEGARVSKR